jgi:hypothetical protein
VSFDSSILLLVLYRVETRETNFGYGADKKRQLIMSTIITNDPDQWALPRMHQILPLSDDELRQILVYADSLTQPEAADHLKNLMGDSPESKEFVISYQKHRKDNKDRDPDYSYQGDQSKPRGAPPVYGGNEALPSTRRVAHTNPFIEAARLRAHDEVRRPA